jgi:hypothetical protein
MENAYCDMTLERLNSEAREMTVARQWLGKHVTLAMDMHTQQ